MERETMAVLVNDQGFQAVMAAIEHRGLGNQADPRILRYIYNQGFLDGAKHVEKMLRPWWRFW